MMMMMMMMMMMIHFIIYVRVEFNSEWTITESVQMQTTAV
jgi:hypothetical protein